MQMASKRAVRIDTGDYLKDASGKPQAYFANDLDSVDLRPPPQARHQNTLDLMTLNDPDPEARRSAVMKLGMIQDPAYVPILQARIPKESSHIVQDALTQAIAIIQLKNPDPAIRIPAIQQLGALTSIPPATSSPPSPRTRPPPRPKSPPPKFPRPHPEPHQLGQLLRHHLPRP